MSSKVSVVIPTYNRAYCLPLALSSALAQTYENIEVIIVDDNSTDNTGQVCRRFQEEFGDKIQYIRNNENFGPSKSRNIAIDRAKGEFIAFLDSDDMYYVDKIQRQVSLMVDDKSVGFCYGQFATTHDIFDTKNYFFPKWKTPSKLYPSFLLPNNFFIVTPTVMLRSSLLEKVGVFDESMKICEDLELWSRILINTKPAFVEKPVAAIHIRKDENINYFVNILAREQLYTRVFERDLHLSEVFKKSLYSNLVDIYFSIANDKNEESEIMNAFKGMQKACKNRFELMRSEIVRIANEMC